LPQHPPCYHCGLESHPDFTQLIQGQAQPFCCLGCQAVAQTIAGSGLAEFYRYRSQVSAKASRDKLAYRAFDQPHVQQAFVVPAQTPGQLRADLYIGGISCAACVWLIEKHLMSLPGVVQVGVNSLNHRAYVIWNPQTLLLSAVFEALAAIGFKPQPQQAAASYLAWQAEQKSALIRLGVAGISMMQAGTVAVGLYAGALQGLDAHWQSILRWITCLFAIPVIFYAAIPFYRASWRALRLRQLSMDVPVSLAILLAFAASFYAAWTETGEVYFESISMFVFILLAGRFLEQRARFRNFQQGANLGSLLPLAVVRVEAEEEALVPLASLQLGQLVKVAAGEIIPCDGQVERGQSYAIEAIMSGEAEPQPKGPGDRVLAGTYNGDSALWVRVRALGPQTQLAAIEQLFESAASARPERLALTDRIASHFVAAVLVVAGLTYGVWYWLDPSQALWIALSVLVITCPCALAIAVPAAWVCALGHLRSRGLLISSSQWFDGLSQVDRVIFDKTGTLTQGQLQVTQVLPLPGAPVEDHLALIASLEQHSVHPIAKAFSQHASAGQLDDGQVHPNQGVEGRLGGRLLRFGRSAFAFPSNPPDYPGLGQWQLLADEQQPLCWVLLEDSLRPSAAACVRQLQALGLRCEILSGDRPENLPPLAQALGITQYQGGATPADKLARLQQLQAAGSRVLMLGDGINDVPVLAGADVSIAMGNASALAQTRAQAVLLHSDLQQLVYGWVYVKQVQRIVRQNLAWALLYNLLALPAAVMGWVPPWLAALGMSVSSLVVVLNALRLAQGVKLPASLNRA
jgi:P-type Cu2+ transporter